MDFAELQAAVLTEYPEAASADDWTVVTALRAYAAAHVDYVINVASPLYVDQNGQAVEARFTTFEADAGGVVCGGTADALTELARAWGYEAWNLGIGDLADGGFTHMQTLIEIEVDGVPVLTLHDPSTNLSYTDASGAPIDYFELLTALAADQRDLVAATEDRHDADNLVARSETADIVAFAESSWTVDPADYSVREVADGWAVRSPRTLARFEEVISPWYGPFLEAHGLPTEAIWLELFPHAIYGADDLLLRASWIARGGAGGRVGYEADEGFVEGDAGGVVNQRYLDEGHPLQTWYYGAILVVATDEGQALRVSRVDGIGGDEEGIFELQGGTTDAVSLAVTAPDDAVVRVLVKDSSYTVIREESVTSGGTFAWADREARIWRVIVEADQGDVLVDDFAWGDAAEPADTGGTPTGDDSGSTGTDDTGADDTGPTGDTDPAGSDGDTTDAGHCGCASGPGVGSVGWIWAAALGLIARRHVRRSG